MENEEYEKPLGYVFAVADKPYCRIRTYRGAFLCGFAPGPRHPTLSISFMSGTGPVAPGLSFAWQTLPYATIQAPEA